MQNKNVLLIIVDQVLVESLGVYGGEICQTPSIDRLAREGITFDRAYTTISLCSPARASMFTGKLPHKHGILYNVTNDRYGRPDLDEDERMLPHYLSASGCQCGYIGKWHIGVKKGPREYGFEGTGYPGYGIPSDFVEDYDEFLKQSGHPGMRHVEIKNVVGAKDFSSVFLPLSETCGDVLKFGEIYSGVIDLPTQLTPAGFVAERTIEFLRKHKEKPFFLTASFWGPHHPAFPSSEFAGRHDPSRIPEWQNFCDELALKPIIQKRYRDFFHKRLSNASWSLWQKIIAAHFDFMSMIDFEIGRILDELKELGLDKNTIVIFTSDHGDTLGCHGGQWDKGPYMYEETYRVPLIVRLPNTPSCERCDALVSNMDIFSTILDIFDCDISSEDEDIDAKSLMPVLTGKQKSIRDNIVGQFYGFDRRGLFFQRMIRDSEYKYIFNPSDIDEFYDLENDPSELVNLINADHEAKNIKRLKMKLVDEMRKNGDPFADFGAKLMGL